MTILIQQKLNKTKQNKTNRYDDYDTRYAVERFTFFVHRLTSSFSSYDFFLLANL